MVLPISEKFNDYAQKVSEFLNRSDVRTEVDDRNEKIGRKIRDNELKRIPYLLIVGEKEEAEGLVSVRAQGEGTDVPGGVPRLHRRTGQRGDRGQQARKEISME